MSIGYDVSPELEYVKQEEISRLQTQFVSEGLSPPQAYQRAVEIVETDIQKRQTIVTVTKDVVTDPVTQEVVAIVPRVNNETMMYAALAAIRIAQMPGGMAAIRGIAQEFIKGTFSTLNACAKAAPGHDVTAWAMPMLISNVYNRLGFLNPGVQEKFEAGISIIAGADVIGDLIKDVSKLFKFTSPTSRGEGLQALVYGNTYTTLPQLET